jgi:hypothetical protein
VKQENIAGKTLLLNTHKSIASNKHGALAKNVASFAAKKNVLFFVNQYSF